MAEVAVLRLHPHCPRCGWLLTVPEEDLEHQPSVAWFPVQCSVCAWAGHAKYWTRQRDEP